MRAVLVIVGVGMFSVFGFAQEKADDVQALKAEVAHLRQENARLKANLAQYGDLLKQYADSAAEARKLEGTWVIETASMDGKVVTSDQGGEVQFIGNAVFARMPGQKVAIRQTFGVYPAQRQLSFRQSMALGERYVPTGTAFDRSNGRYEWDGDTLLISLQSAYTIPKDVSDREQVLWVLKRKKP